MEAGHLRDLFLCGCTVACESIHPQFSYFVALQPGIKLDFWGVCIIWFTQHPYNFEDATYFFLWNKQEIKLKSRKPERA